MRIEEIRRQNLIWLIEQDYQGVDANLARALGIQASQISRIFSSNSAHRRNIGRNLAQKIERITGKPDGWMDLVHEFVDYEAGTQRTRHAPAEKRPPLLPRSNVATVPPIKRVVPLIGWNEAGRWPEIKDGQQALEKYLCPVECSEHTYVLRVTGISMEPRFRDGELIFIDPAVPPEHGKFVIVRLEADQEPVFRQLIIEGGRRYLKALNEDWPERVTEPGESAVYCGVVIFKGEKI